MALSLPILQHLSTWKILIKFDVSNYITKGLDTKDIPHDAAPNQDDD